MEIIDISWRESKNLRCNNTLLPKSVRSVIVRKSGCGKTTLLLNLPLTPDYLDYFLENPCFRRNTKLSRKLLR